MNNRTPIGYWRSKYEPHYPVPVAGSATDEQVRQQLQKLDRVTKGAQLLRYRGWSTCRICGQANGSEEFGLKNHVIPTGLRHYIEVHHVLVPGLLEL